MTQPMAELKHAWKVQEDRQKKLSLAKRNAALLKSMSILESVCGITHDEYEQIHGAMRARVRARWLS